MWSQNDSGDGVNTGPRSGMTWEEALAWVQEKNDENYLGYSDWRLPNAKEMQSIVDYSRAPGATGSAAIDPVFNITQITNENGETDYPWFWTSGFYAFHSCVTFENHIFFFYVHSLTEEVENGWNPFSPKKGY